MFSDTEEVLDKASADHVVLLSDMRRRRRRGHKFHDGSKNIFHGKFSKKYKFMRVSLVDFITVLGQPHRTIFKNKFSIKTPFSFN